VKQAPPETPARDRLEHDVSDADKRCQCGACRTRLGEEVSGQYDVLPPIFRGLEHALFVFACPKCNSAPKTAEQNPPAPLPRTQASAGILAWSGAGKFVDGLPLNQIVTIAARHFRCAVRDRLLGWMIKAENRLLSPLTAAMDRVLRQSNYEHMEETTLQVREQHNHRGQQESWFWFRVTGAGTPIVLLGAYSAQV